MIRSFVFSQTEGKLISQDITLDLLSVFLHDDGVQFWVDAGEVSNDEAKALLEGVFHFHPLAIEDCLAPSDRPKIDEYEDSVFMVIHAVDYSHSAHEFKTTELNMFIGRNFLVTFHRDPLRSINSTLDRVVKNAPHVARAPDRLTYTILNFLLENYAPALESLSAEIADLEDAVLQQHSADVLNRIVKLKTEVQRLRQIVWPQREVITRLAHGEFKLVRTHMLPYYRDLLDQLVRISTLAENYRDSLTSILQLHLNFQQTQTNMVVKVLTVMATLFMPILVVTSFYGMNFEGHWPEYKASHPYYWVFGITGASTLFLYLLLKRKGWW
ncbi:MAG: magnesium and cobalt transport protein CorA [Verrucomicrobia bacterium]|nr:magnesium and cobalt transport protein CorA [Verrucomicrobiota bacterium]